MKSPLNPSKENKSTANTHHQPMTQNAKQPTLQFLDERPEALAEPDWQKIVNESEQTQELQRAQQLLNGKPQDQSAIQLQAMADQQAAQTPQSNQIAPNNTGLPDDLKAGIENISGYAMDDVQVHYNSDKPAQIQAHAYAQGTDIHLAPGQEKHLPHEAWHVVQQKQGRVEATKQLQGAVFMNDDENLEKEADLMGAKAEGLEWRKYSANFDGPKKQVESTSLRPLQRAKAVKITLDNPISGAHKIMKIDVNTDDLRNHWIALREQMGEKPEAEFVDRHIFDIAHMAKYIVRKYEGKSLSEIGVFTNDDDSALASEVLPQVEGMIAKHIRELNNEILTDDLKNQARGEVIKTSWHFWGEPQENSFRNIYETRMRAELRQAMVTGASKEQLDGIREAILFALFDTPTYTDYPMDVETYTLIRNRWLEYMKVLISEDELFQGFEMPENFAERTPARVREDWQADPEATFYEMSKTAKLYEMVREPLEAIDELVDVAVGISDEHLQQDSD